MKKLIIHAAVIFATCFGGGVMAIQKDITITGTVDNSISITQLDGTELPSLVTMRYTPGQGLAPVVLPVTIYNNAAGGNTPKGVKIRLTTAPILALVSDNTVAEDLRVTLGGTELGVADVLFDQAKAQYDTASKKSQQLNLVIQQKKQAAMSRAGAWQGNIGLIFTPEA